MTLVLQKMERHTSGDGSLDPRKEDVLWFHLPVNPDWACWAFKEGSSMKRIAALELFGTLLLVRSLTERKEDPSLWQVTTKAMCTHSSRRRLRSVCCPTIGTARNLDIGNLVCSSVLWRSESARSRSSEKGTSSPSTSSSGCMMSRSRLRKGLISKRCFL